VTEGIDERRLREGKGRSEMRLVKEGLLVFCTLGLELRTKTLNPLLVLREFLYS
jgi:hypothetical protein